MRPYCKAVYSNHHENIFIRHWTNQNKESKVKKASHVIDAFADLWFWFVLEVGSLRPVERDGASSLWTKITEIDWIIHSFITRCLKKRQICMRRNVEILALQMTLKTSIQN